MIKRVPARAASIRQGDVEHFSSPSTNTRSPLTAFPPTPAAVTTTLPVELPPKPRAEPLTAAKPIPVPAINTTAAAAANHGRMLRDFGAGGGSDSITGGMLESRPESALGCATATAGTGANACTGGGAEPPARSKPVGTRALVGGAETLRGAGADAVGADAVGAETGGMGMGGSGALFRALDARASTGPDTL